ncbi:MAG: hypothetical protein ACTSP9_07840 [Promethearchaeota archaeon]
MRHFYKSHGKHCYLRSFKTSCPKCKTDVLYWECTHGSKIFFEYPPYGKLNQRSDRFQVIIKKPIGLLKKARISCPVCGKLFENENYLKDHINQMKKNDDNHKIFLEDQYIFDNSTIEKETKYYPKFGRIIIKKGK